MKRFFLSVIFILSLSEAFAKDFILSEVVVNCTDSELCISRKQRFSNLAGEYRSLLHLKDILRVLASDGGYKSLSYNILSKNEKRELIVDIKMKPMIKGINIGTVDLNLPLDPSQLLTIKEGEFFETEELKQNLLSMQKKLESMGYPENSFELNVREKQDKIYITIQIKLGRTRIFKKIKTDSNSAFVNEFITRKFYNFYNKPFEFTKFKLFLDEAQKELFNYGYYLINLDFAPKINNFRVTLDIKVSQDKLFAFDLRNIERENPEVIHNLIKDLFRKYKRPLTESVLKQALVEHYRQRALLNVHLKISQESFKNKYKEKVSLYRIHFDEGEKTVLKKINFLGNSFFSKNELNTIFTDESFELARYHFYDEEYLNYFVGLLKSKYIAQGFVQAKITGPVKVIDSNRQEATVEYIIQEGQRAFVRTLSFEGLPPGIEQKVSKGLANLVGSHFDPIALADDLKLVTNTLHDEGYFYAEVENATDDSLVHYSKSGTDVDLRFIIRAGPQLRLNRVIYLGNNKTRRRVLSKKLMIEKGDLLTPAKTKDFESSLSATGLFNSVTVTPLKHSSKTNAATDLIVKLVERDYGLVELAPGFRTDLGAKLTATASYVNIGGMNRSLTLRSQINQRLNYQTFDPRRRKERRQLVEHNEALTYTQGDIFDTLITSSTGLSYQRKRFYSFDAEIFRVNNTFSWDLTKKLSSSVRYQYEAITQSDATELRDNDSFKIGAITPSLTYDLRNNPVNPIKGAFFNMSCEFANPYFLSQKENELTINYYKLISRNRFYLPYKFGTLAVSMVAGVQENLANETVNVNGVNQSIGYIPNIKVFRLTGMDIVRGYNDEEINRVAGDNKDDISEVKIQERAYLANFKVEPRYFINDTLMAGIFYDAGRVFVNQVDMGKLRDSVGLTFKILTPVGTLDFDYGIKLLRERNKNGSLEDPGRFHVSIGFF